MRRSRVISVPVYRSVETRPGASVGALSAHANMVSGALGSFGLKIYFGFRASGLRLKISGLGGRGVEFRGDPALRSLLSPELRMKAGDGASGVQVVTA